MDLLMLDPVSEDQLSLFVIFVGSGSTILDVDCGSIFIGSIVVGFIVTGSESFVIGSVLNFGCRISLSLKIHSVLWLYAPVNWGVGSFFQLQKMHIFSFFLSPGFSNSLKEKVPRIGANCSCEELEIREKFSNKSQHYFCPADAASLRVVK